jgi:hypothetical protein
MSAPRLILRILVATVTVIAVGTTAVLGFSVIEPIEGQFSAPASLGWGNVGGTVLTFAAAGFLSLLLVLIIWFIAAPIRRDKRQQFRR